MSHSPINYSTSESWHSCRLSSTYALRSEAPDVRDADQFLRLARQHAERLAPPSPQFGYLGPLPPAMEKRSGRYRRQLSIHASSRPRLQQLLTLLCQQLEQTPLGKKVRWSVDVDPVDMS